MGGNHKDCPGCVSYDSKKNICNEKLISPEVIEFCPCRVCVIKVMCTNACDIFWDLE